MVLDTSVALSGAPVSKGTGETVAGGRAAGELAGSFREICAFWTVELLNIECSDFYHFSCWGKLHIVTFSYKPIIIHLKLKKKKYHQLLMHMSCQLCHYRNE